MLHCWYLHYLAVCEVWCSAGMKAGLLAPVSWVLSHSACRLWLMYTWPFLSSHTTPLTSWTIGFTLSVTSSSDRYLGRPVNKREKQCYYPQRGEISVGEKPPHRMQRNRRRLGTNSISTVKYVLNIRSVCSSTDETNF